MSKFFLPEVACNDTVYLSYFLTNRYLVFIISSCLILFSCIRISQGGSMGFFRANTFQVWALTTSPSIKIWKNYRLSCKDKDEKLLWSELKWHQNCHCNEMTPLPNLRVVIYLGTENYFSKIVHGNFFLL